MILIISNFICIALANADNTLCSTSLKVVVVNASTFHADEQDDDRLFHAAALIDGSAMMVKDVTG
jgi:hypothetical protein